MADSFCCSLQDIRKLNIHANTLSQDKQVVNFIYDTLRFLS